MSLRLKALIIFAAAIMLLAFLSLAKLFVKNEVDIRVGSKNFTEQIILGEIIAQTIEKQLGATVERTFNLGGTFICFNALKNDELDIYVEYTGTALTAILKQEIMSDPRQVYDAVHHGGDRKGRGHSVLFYEAQKFLGFKSGHDHDLIPQDQ